MKKTKKATVEVAHDECRSSTEDKNAECTQARISQFPSLSDCLSTVLTPYLIFVAFADDVGEIVRGGIALAAGHVAQIAVGGGGAGRQRDGQRQREYLHVCCCRASSSSSSSSSSNLFKSHRGGRDSPP